jgi:hypothetical protein
MRSVDKFVEEKCRTCERSRLLFAKGSLPIEGAAPRSSGVKEAEEYAESIDPLP